jgi:exopolysaccharide biosynthesis protein
MYELADLMGRLGCTYALNLDGGGSSTMVYEGAVKNSPKGDEDEGAGQQVVRRVSDAIVVLPKNGQNKG